MGQLPLPFVSSAQDLEAAIRKLLSSWPGMRIWARCVEGCAWCRLGPDDPHRRRHEAARDLARFVGPAT